MVLGNITNTGWMIFANQNLMRDCVKTSFQWDTLPKNGSE